MTTNEGCVLNLLDDGDDSAELLHINNNGQSENDDEDSDVYNTLALQPDDFNVIQEYRSLAEHFRSLPRDMFVAQVVRDYSSSEPDLDRLRTEYFEHLKNVYVDFPFGSDAELKRRVYTRSGEPVAVKLAQDIHSIIDVVKGGDCSVLKPLISVSKKRKSSVGIRNNNNNITNINTCGKCTCSIELSSLKDIVSGVQADILLLKQSIHASERLRSEQTSVTRTALENISTEIRTYGINVKKFSLDAETSIRSLTNSLAQRITEFEDRVRLIEGFLETEQIVTIASLNTNTFYGDSGGSIQEKQHKVGIEESPTTNVLCHDEEDDQNETYTKPSRSKSTKYDSAVQSTVKSAARHVDADNHVGKQDVGNPIPVRVTSRVSTDNQYDDGFILQTRKRTKRFCIRGLSSKVNVDVLRTVIGKKGPKVTSMRVFPLRRNPGKVLLQLNVAADENTHLLLSNDFWPRYVKCEPWKPKRTLTTMSVPPRMRHRRNESYEREVDFVQQWDLEHGNRFASLISDVD